MLFLTGSDILTIKHNQNISDHNSLLGHWIFFFSNLTILHVAIAHFEAPGQIPDTHGGCHWEEGTVVAPGVKMPYQD